MKHLSVRTVCIALALVLLMSFAPFALADEAAQPTFELRLGVSNYYMQVPSTYTRGLMTPEDVADNMVAYYKSEENEMDFDVYQFSKADEPAVLADYAAKEAAEFDSTPVSVVLNGNPSCYYDAVKEYEGVSYPTRTYILDTGTGYTEVMFWLDGENPEAVMESIISSVQFMRSLRLGVSIFYVNIPNSYSRGTVTAEDVAKGMVGYYMSEESTLDFDVYQFSKEGLPAALEDYAAAAAAEHEAVATVGQINGIAVASFAAEQDYNGESYSTRTYILDTGTGYVVVTFWLDGETAEAEALRIMNSLSGKINLTLADSAYSLTVPYGFTQGEVTEEERAEGVVDYFKSDRSLLDFDIFRIEKEDPSMELAAFTAEQAAVYGVPTTDTAINRIPISYFRAMEEYEGVNYKILVFALDADDSFVVIRFWLDGDTAADAAMGIIKTLDKTLAVTLGSSEHTISVPGSYYMGEVTEEDSAEGIIAYYKSDATLLDFDIFEFAKDGRPETLEAFAAEEAANYGVTVTDTAIKGVPVSYYRAMESYEGETYRILVFALDGGENYLTIRFWLDGDTAADEAMSIIRTIK